MGILWGSMSAPNTLTIDVNKLEVFEKSICITASFSLENIKHIDYIKINDMEFKRVR